MGKPVREWSNDSISIAVEGGKDDANKEREAHVHVYKSNRRTEIRIALSGTTGNGLDNKDIETAERLFDQNLREIEKEYEKVRNGYYGD